MFEKLVYFFINVLVASDNDTFLKPWPTVFLDGNFIRLGLYDHIGHRTKLNSLHEKCPDNLNKTVQ